MSKLKCGRNFKLSVKKKSLIYQTAGESGHHMTLRRPRDPGKKIPTHKRGETITWWFECSQLHSLKEGKKKNNNSVFIGKGLQILRVPNSSSLQSTANHEAHAYFVLLARKTFWFSPHSSLLRSTIRFAKITAVCSRRRPPPPQPLSKVTLLLVLIFSHQSQVAFLALPQTRFVQHHTSSTRSICNQTEPSAAQPFPYPPYGRISMPKGCFYCFKYISLNGDLVVYLSCCVTNKAAKTIPCQFHSSTAEVRVAWNWHTIYLALPRSTPQGNNLKL